MSAERRSFLMSGVPEEMRRHRAVIEAAAAAMTEASAPWPRYNHVRQWEGSESWGEGAAEMRLKLREEGDEECVEAKSVWKKTERSVKREITLVSNISDFMTSFRLPVVGLLESPKAHMFQSSVAIL
jgi:hypothetical protein